MKKTLLAAFLLTTVLLGVARADTLIGTFDVYGLYNAAGCYPTGGPTDGNPYRCSSGIPPGPFFINAAPGHYKLVVEFGLGCGVWSGDASSGRFFVTGHNPSEVVEFDHQFGQIVLFFWDWYAADNDPLAHTIISLYAVSTNQPTIRITRVTTSDTGVLSGGELPFCSADTIHCEATTANADGLSISWSVQFDSPSIGFLPIFGGLSDVLDFNVDLSAYPWMNPETPRPRETLTFRIMARLMDGNVEKANDQIHVDQSLLGQLRQEYVDHAILETIRIPAVSEFNSLYPPVPDGCNGWNTGDYPWSIIPSWAVESYEKVNSEARAHELISAAAFLQVNSVYRNPTRNTRRGGADKSKHMFGLGIDLQVFDWARPFTGKAEPNDWALLKRLCEPDFWTERLAQSKAGHVHIEPPK